MSTFATRLRGAVALALGRPCTAALARFWLAGHAGVDATTVRAWLDGRAEPDEQQLARLAAALRVEAKYLASGRAARWVPC